MVALCWLSSLQQDLDFPPPQLTGYDSPSLENIPKPTIEKLALLWGKIIDCSKTSTPDLSDILNLVRELISTLHPNQNLSLETSKNNPVLAIDPILLIDNLLFILNGHLEYGSRFVIKIEPLKVQNSSGDPNADPDLLNNQMILKIMLASEQSLRPTSPSFSIDSNTAWSIYQNAFAAQGSRIRLRNPEDPEELVAEMLLNTLGAMP